MALREVLQFPDPRLKRRSEPVGEVTEELRQLASDMIEVMYDEPGIGLAAPQVGAAVRMVVMDTSWSDDEGDGLRDPKVMINPEILEREGDVTWTEGCLSVPDLQADVERAARVKVRYHDLEGVEHVEDVAELRAVCFQHEIDHLDGILFIDRISRLKRNLYVKKRKKMLREEEEAGDGASGGTLL
jgi:peptide deformylase